MVYVYARGTKAAHSFGDSHMCAHIQVARDATKPSIQCTSEGFEGCAQARARLPPLEEERSRVTMYRESITAADKKVGPVGLAAHVVYVLLLINRERHYVSAISAALSYRALR